MHHHPARRLVAAAVALSALAGACSSSDHHRAAPAPAPTPTVAPPTAPLDLRGLTALGWHATTVRAETPAGFALRAIGDVGQDDAGGTGIGGTVLDVADNRADGAVLSSTDLGRTWRPVAQLGPGATGRFPKVRRLGDMVVVTDVPPTGTNPSVWTTTDGTTWKGGRLPGSLAEGVGSPERLADGRLGLATNAQGRGTVLATADGGATWNAIRCPAAGQMANGCELPTDAGGGLLVLDGALTQVSRDAGRVWQDPRVVPDPHSDPPPTLSRIVSLPGGGWLAVAQIPSPGLDDISAVVVRSDDGRVWQTVIPDSCPPVLSPAGPSHVHSSFAPPVPIGGRWLVAYDCDDGSGPPRAALYALDGAGRNPKAVARSTGTDAVLGWPMATLAGVAIPVVDQVAEFHTIIQVRP